MQSTLNGRAMSPFTSSAVAAKFDAYPLPVRRKLLATLHSRSLAAE